MWDKIFIWKKETKENPINDGQYQKLLWLHPALTNEIQRHVQDVLFEDVYELHKDELYDNHSIISEESIIQAKRELVAELEQLEQSTGESQHIVIVVDDCFTNKKLLVLIKKILGRENFRRFVKVVHIDYNKKADNGYLEEHLSMNHSLFILGGSLSDTYHMDYSHYSSYLAELIQQVWDEYAPKFLNKRLLWICFGQQYLANIIWMANKNSSGIIATLKWPSQFAPSNCSIQELKYVNPIYQEALSWLSNRSTNSHFSSMFTRSGYVSFNLLWSEGALWVVPLIKDDATSWIVWWGSKNGNVLWVQFHPEIHFLTHRNNTKKHLREIVEIVSADEEEQQKYMKNFEIGDKVERDIWEAFYVFSILAYIKDINLSYHRISSILGDPMPIPHVSYVEATKRLMETVSGRVDFIMTDHLYPENDRIMTEWIDAIDRKWRLLLNHQLDWKVNRSIREISEILWVRSITNLIEEHRNLQKNGNYIVRDLWAGDGNTIRELYGNLKMRDIVIYGTGDYIYFDLFSAINTTGFSSTMPEELIILFVEKVVGEFRGLHGVSTIRKIKQAVEQARFNRNNTIRNSSMTNKKTLMFESEHDTPLSPEIRNNFDAYLVKLEELRRFVIENIYFLFSGYFQRIYISKFNDLMIQDEVISRIDFQYSIRATSHVNGREYMKIISEYFYNAAKPGSIFVDNGIHQSYTSIPRIKELYDISLDIVWWNFRLVYNKRKNYFSSVIITKEADYGDEFWEGHLDSDSIMVPLREAYMSTFFRLEYFIRNFIISNFKNNIVFWNFNEQIVDTLEMIMRELEKKDTGKISSIILDLINHIAKNYGNQETVYNEINVSILNSYVIGGERLRDILDADIFIPTWMNVHANRDY